MTAKRLAAVLCAAMMTVLSACGASEKPARPAADPAEETTAQANATEAAETLSEALTGYGDGGADALPEEPDGYGDAGAGAAWEMGEPAVRALWAADAALTENGFDEVRATDAPTARVAFIADAPVRDFRIVKLAIRMFNDDGSPQFLETEIYRQETLSPGRPLVAALAFAGDLPEFGISFTDPAGETHSYTLEISGEDGSLLLTEF